MVIEKTYREEWSQDLTVPCKSVMILGEFHKKTKTIYVNLNVSIEKKHIITHELGHYFIDHFGLKMSKTDEEKTVQEFAETLESPSEDGGNKYY